MNKLFKVVLVFSLLLLSLFATAQVGHAQTLEEQREGVVQSFMQGIIRSFSYEEVDAYISSEESEVLETGTIRALSSYGIDGSHSTGQGLSLADYLMKYLDANTNESDLEELYPYAVDFSELPEKIHFYRYGQEGIIVEKNGGQPIIYENEYNAHWTHLKSVRKYNGRLEDNATQEFAVYPSDEIARNVKINTSVVVQELSAHRTDYVFYFFYNEHGTLSLIKWDLENPVGEYAEYTTRETYEELTGNIGANTASDWELPHDWRMLSPRREDVPPVTWVLTSVGDGKTIAIEPVYSSEGIVSGYINPNYSVEITTKNFMTEEISPIYSASPDTSGYFSIDVDATVGNPPTIKVLNENGQMVYENALGVHQYRPTALAHDSGYLTLERYFVDQAYVEGQTYPYAEVRIHNLNGYATISSEGTVADANGYFYVDSQRHPNNLTTSVITVTHPETGEDISVAPYPWTASELENAAW